MIKLSGLPGDITIDKFRSSIPGFIHSLQKGKDIYVFNSNQRTQDMLKTKYPNIQLSVIDSDSALYEEAKTSPLLRVLSIYNEYNKDYKGDVLFIIRSIPSEASDSKGACAYIKDIASSVYVTSEQEPIRVNIRNWLRSDVMEMKNAKEVKDMKGADANFFFNVIRAPMRNKQDKAISIIFHTDAS